MQTASQVAGQRTIVKSMSRSGRRSLARFLLVAFAGLWLQAVAAPCAMADSPPRHECPPASGTIEAHDETCPSSQRVDCALPDPNPVVLDFFAKIETPVATLTLLPAPAAAPPSMALERHSDNAALRAPPPLALRPAVLLI